MPHLLRVAVEKIDNQLNHSDSIIMRPLLKKFKKNGSEKAKFKFDPKEMKRDPITQLGYGVVAYFDILHGLFYLFLILSLLQLPALYIYASGSGYYNAKGFETWSIGNLGYSSVKCA